jgi:polysaccharide export outer membrane protein
MPELSIRTSLTASQTAPQTASTFRIACSCLLGLAVLAYPATCRAQMAEMAGQPQPPKAALAQDSIQPSESLGADDLIEIMVSYCPELSRTFRVSSDGTLALPLLHQRIKVSGLTPMQVSEALQQALIKENIMADPTVNVSVLEYRSRPVSVVGAVNRPLTFQATGQTTLLDAIARAGGMSPTAGSSIIVTDNHVSPEAAASGTLQSNVKIIPTKYLLGSADPKYNIRLIGDEEVRIPEASKIFVAGDVKKPGMYPMQNDNETTVVKAIALSGGLDSYSAHVAYIYRSRPSGGEREEVQVPLKDILSHKAPDMTLAADDILFIPTANGRKLTARVISDLAALGGAAAVGILIYH